ncbi:MAG: LysR family transcriptional regulator [Candidatus Thiodiazotropha endolucinida]
MDLLKSIEIFQAVCRQKSFSQAAQQLNLVPSAVSRQINELEKHLGVRLLHRTTRSVSLTDEGRRYLQKMEAITHTVEELKTLNSDDDIIQDHIRLTAPPILGPQFLNKIVESYLRQYPDVSLSITLVNREINLIEEGYDIALRVGTLDDSNLVARVVGHFPLVAVASPTYLETHGEPKHPKVLTKHNCIINTLTQSPRRWFFREGKRNFSIKVDGQCDANDDATLKVMACASLGIAYLPKLAVHEQIENGELISILGKFIPNPLPVSVVYPSRQYLSKAKRILLEQLVDNR